MTNKLETKFKYYLGIYIFFNILVSSIMSGYFAYYQSKSVLETSTNGILSNIYSTVQSTVNSSTEELYSRSFQALDTKLNVVLERLETHFPELIVCVNLTSTFPSNYHPFQLRVCTNEGVFEQNFTSFDLKTFQYFISDILVAEYSIEVINKEAVTPGGKGWWLVLIAAHIFQIIVATIVGTYLLHGKVSKPVLDEYSNNQTKLLSSSIKRSVEEQVLQRMLNYSHSFAQARKENLHSILIGMLRDDHLLNVKLIISGSDVVHSSLNLDCSLVSGFLSIVSGSNTKDSVLKVCTNPESNPNEWMMEISKILDVDSLYIALIKVSEPNKDILVVLNKLSDINLDDLKKYFSMLNLTLKDYIHNTLKFRRETSAKFLLSSNSDRDNLIDDNTRYVEYSHPYSYIYDKLGYEVKFKISLSKLCEKYPQHLTQCSKSFLVNPRYTNIDNSGALLAIKVSLNARVVSLKLSPVYKKNF